MGIVHRLWLGPNEMPEKYKIYGQRWALLNPYWMVIDWTEKDISRIQWRNQAVIDDIRKRGGNSVEAAVQIADVLGYEIVHMFGGLYVNVDIEPIRDIEYMRSHFEISPAAAYAGREDTTTSRIVNAVLGGPAGHPFWNYVINQLGPRYQQHPGADMVATTGPALLTDCVYGWQDEFAPFKILTQRAFNSVHWKEIPYGEDASGRWTDDPDIIGIHHWGHRRDGRSNTVGQAGRAT